jgi:peptide/nickel transport system permease protein
MSLECFCAGDRPYLQLANSGVVAASFSGSDRAAAMKVFFAKRLGYLLLTMFAVSLAVFVIMEFTPGQAARKILGPYATQEQVDILTEEMGLNRPILVRYVEWIGKVARGDLGYSTLYRRPVAEILGDRLRNTGILAALAFAIIVPASIVFGVVAGTREASLVDRTISLASIVTTSIPEFVSGVFLVSIFVISLNLLPGVSTLDAGGRWGIVSQLVLPVLVAVLYDLGYVVRMVRASVAEVMAEYYIRTAFLKGLSFADVVIKHVLRNALIAPFTVILLQINYLVTGLVVVESLFAYPGFGQMLLAAGLNQDVAVVEAAALVAVSINVATQIAGDLVYMLLNPRIRVA